MLIAKLFICTSHLDPITKFQTSFDNQHIMELIPTEQKHWAAMLPIYRNLVKPFNFFNFYKSNTLQNIKMHIL